MSIYAALWSLKFPRYGDFYVGCEWIEVTAQGVPARYPMAARLILLNVLPRRVAWIEAQRHLRRCGVAARRQDNGRGQYHRIARAHGDLAIDGIGRITPLVDDLGQAHVKALERLESQPTVNIEGLVGGYTGPGGKTILPHQAVAKMDLRLVPGMKATEALAALKAHLAKRGFGDIEVNMTGGYDPTTTPADTPLIQAQVAVLKRAGIDPGLWPWNAGSYPGYVFTSEPLNLASGHFGLGHGSGAHAPDEYYVIDSTNPKVQGFDGAVMSFVEYLYELGK
jgi:acetylornithine deacetylase/succinyl-diaminopimelate desuccinylase-like protein